MQEEYQVRRLPRNREYAAYQFHARLKYKDQSAEKSFCYVALTLIDWLKERITQKEIIPKEIMNLPDRNGFADIVPGALESFRVNTGFTADVSASPEDLLWALRLKEPDSDVNDRKALPGRFFTTNVGLCPAADDEIEIGIRIDVTDPEDAEEVGYAFRPKFLRYLFREDNIVLSHICGLNYDKSMQVTNEQEFKALRTLLDSSQSQLPVIAFSEAVREPDLDTAMNAEIDFLGFSSGLTPGKRAVIIPGQAPVYEKYYPYDPNEFASHAFGYAITANVSEEYRNALSKRLHKEYEPGDILFIEPKRFGGNVRIIEKNSFKAEIRLKDRMHAFSKHKNYSFGNVLFEYDIRSIAQRREIDRIRRSDEMAAEEKLNRLNQLIEDLQKENEKQILKIDSLKQQNNEEYRRGVEAERHDMEQLMAEYEQLEEQLHGLKANNSRLEKENASARHLKETVDIFRSLSEMPKTTDDVIDYFSRVFGDSIAFTERGRKSAHKCSIRPDGLWYYLYYMATELIALYRNHRPDIESEFNARTGIEVALGESSQSHNNNSIMKTRADTYEGKEIWIEPHLKLVPQRAGADYQRIYYCYDFEIDKIIIGSVGDHLITYGTQFVD